jgi:hypothetical protein
MTARSSATVPVFSHLGLAPRRTRETSRWTAIAPYALWAVQVALALLFVFAGGVKFVMSAEDLTKNTALSATFLRFIGVCEVLGAIGLVLPGALRFGRVLTPLAAIGLVIIMVGATVVTTVEMGVADAIFPFAVGLFLALVLYSRRTWLSSALMPQTRRTR